MMSSTTTSAGCALRTRASAARAVGGLEHAVAGLLEREAHHLADVTVVVDYQYRGHAWLALARLHGSCEQRAYASARATPAVLCAQLDA